MSFLFGGGGAGRNRVDPEMARGRKRAELRLARDIGDQAALNRNGEPPPRRGMRMWPVAVIAVIMVLGALGLLPRVHRFELARDCNSPKVALERNDVAPGFGMEWKGTGPNPGDYVLVDGGGAVTAQGDAVRVDGGTALSPVFQMTNCLTDQTVAAPRSPGNHNLRLMHDTGSGFTEVYSISLTVKK